METCAFVLNTAIDGWNFLVVGGIKIIDVTWAGLAGGLDWLDRKQKREGRRLPLVKTV